MSKALQTPEDAHKATTIYRSLRSLRERGWTVAIHNDYLKHGVHHTFWLFTNANTGRFVKGESTEDFYAINQVTKQVDDMNAIV